jgi:hypothetical protein
MKMSKFKVGDYVQLNPECKEFKDGKGRVEYGDVGVISKYISESYLIVNFEGKCHDWYGYEDELIFYRPVKTTDNLITGDIVTLENGDRLYFDGFHFEDLSDENNNNLCNEYDLNHDLTMKARSCSESDIVKVERPMKYATVFERVKVVREMTISEISKALGYEVKIVKEAE